FGDPSCRVHRCAGGSVQFAHVVHLDDFDAVEKLTGLLSKVHHQNCTHGEIWYQKSAEILSAAGFVALIQLIFGKPGGTDHRPDVVFQCSQSVRPGAIGFGKIQEYIGSKPCQAVSQTVADKYTSPIL